MRLSALALLLVLAGCATGRPDSGALVEIPGSAPAVDFPVTASPRPIVVIGPILEVVDGFRNNEEKTGSLNGVYELAGPLPNTPEATPVTLPDGPVTLPFIGVDEALRAMSEPKAGAGTRPTMKLVSAEFGTADFHTDRGRWALPAWRFTTEAGSVVAWPALPRTAFWKPGEVRPAITSGPASGSDELTVTLPAPPAPCSGDAPARNEPVLHETDNVVSVGVRTIGTVGECPRTLALITQPYQVKLAKPLGNRLLVDEAGGVIVVTAR